MLETRLLSGCVPWKRNTWFQSCWKTFDLAGINVSYVVSSPSCRARETAIFAFDRIDQIEPAILHRTAQINSQDKEFGDKFRSVIDAIPIEKVQML